MKRYKIQYLIAPLFLLLINAGVSSCKHKDAAPKTAPTLQLSARLGGITYLDTVPTINIATTLTNPTADTLHFVSMSCSYEDMFVTNTPNYQITSRRDCYKNYPEVIALPPHAKLDQFIIIRPTAKTVNVINTKIKVGMYYVVPQKENGFEDIIKQYDNREAAKILWSEELDLKRLYRKVYK